MKLYKKILLILLVVFIAIQSIQPIPNTCVKLSSTDISKIVNVPSGVLSIFKNACYDCHSDNTRYPWYAYVQPVGWLLADHIKNGKVNLNFSDFGAYSQRKQANKIRAIETSIEEGSMPPASYKMLHPSAKFSAADKKIISDWALETKDSLMIKK